LFEILTLVQTGKGPRVPIVLFDEAYWRSLIRFDVLVERGMIDPADLDLIRFADTAEAAWREVSAGVLAAEGGARL
jgi:predicted Rossmann-fold nucleotide-binding protein